MKKFLMLVLVFGLVLDQGSAIKVFRDGKTVDWSQITSDFEWTERGTTLGSYKSYVPESIKNEVVPTIFRQDDYYYQGEVKKHPNYETTYTSPTSVTTPVVSTCTSSILRTEARPYARVNEIEVRTYQPVLALSIENIGCTVSDVLTSAEVSVSIDGLRGQDYEGLFVRIGDYVESVQSDGTADFDMRALRIAKGDSVDYDVEIGIFNEDGVFAVPSSLLYLNVDSVKMSQETGYKEYQTVPQGAVSRAIVFEQSSGFEGGDVDVSSSSTIDGKWAFEGTFRAQYEDAYLSEWTIYNVYGIGADDAIDTVYAIDVNTGEILDEARMYNGEVQFDFSPEVLIPRSGKREIGVKVEVASNARNADRVVRFETDIAGTRVIGASSDYEYGAGQKTLTSSQSEDFVLWGTEALPEIISLVDQPNLNTSGQMGALYKFEITNPSDGEMSFGKMSFNVGVSNAEFVGGISADDFELSSISSRGPFRDLGWTVDLNGSTISFEGDEFTLDSGESQEFVLIGRVNSTGDNSRVYVRFLTGDQASSGVYNTVEGSGANFIWSDMSDVPHSKYSDDWFSGYDLDIAPSDSVRID